MVFSTFKYVYLLALTIHSVKKFKA